MRQLVEKELTGILAKIDHNMKLYKNQTPCISPNLRYSERLSQDGDWTGSFWMGMVAMAGALTDEEKYQTYLVDFLKFYQDRLEYGYKDHDLGFLYQLYAVDGYRLTNDRRFAKLAVSAAEALLCRYNPRGGYIRAWERLINPYRRGKLIIDCLLNLPLLFCAAQMSSNADMKQAAYNHAKATLHNIRPDGSTYHTYNFDDVTGKPLGGENEGGYSDESCWSRGQSWGIYGFYLAWLHTQDEQFLAAAIKVADYFLAHLDASHMPKWDFVLDDRAPSPEAIDTSAAAIAASALYDLCKVVPADKAAVYETAADDMLRTLIEQHSHTFDSNAEALLDDCYCGGWDGGSRVVHQWGSIWGDYFYMEALVKKSGVPIQMWSL